MGWLSEDKCESVVPATHSSSKCSSGPWPSEYSSKPKVAFTTVSRLGAPVSSDLTARELDRAVRSTFALKGPATTNLTQLFEEARYSLHEIDDDDADKAHEYLESVAEELKIQLEAVT